ncbi:MAG: toll/interleukin-1 receptor domain-containing protein [bacterium]
MRLRGELTRKLTNCFLSINPEDFGIEIDRIAKLNVDKTVTLLDGELLGTNQLMDSVVGLFEVRRMNEAFMSGAEKYIPDRYFIGGEGYEKPDPDEFENMVSKEFVDRIQRCLPEWDRGEWDDEPAKFGLCPVTRGIVEKASRLSKPARVAHGDYDVFVTFATEDIALAQGVRDRIKAETDLSVFFSSELDHSAWGEMIERALASANCLVAVGTTPRYLSKPWPEFEYRLFHILIRNQRKPQNAQVMSYISGFEPADLPLPLPYYNAHVHDANEPQASMGRLIRDIRKSFPRLQNSWNR